MSLDTGFARHILMSEQYNDPSIVILEPTVLAQRVKYEIVSFHGSIANTPGLTLFQVWIAAPGTEKTGLDRPNHDQSASNA